MSVRQMVSDALAARNAENGLYIPEQNAPAEIRRTIDQQQTPIPSSTTTRTLASHGDFIAIYDDHVRDLSAQHNSITGRLLSVDSQN